jgi:hypothetical protein
VRLHPIHPILMSVLLYSYEQLTECILQVEQMMVKVGGLLKKGRRRYDAARLYLVKTRVPTLRVELARHTLFEKLEVLF